MTADDDREDRDLGALLLAWADHGYEVYIVAGQWQAWHKDAGDTDLLDGATPEELNRAIRADWSRREPGGSAV